MLNLIKSELIKIKSIKSTWIILTIAVAGTIAFSAMIFALLSTVMNTILKEAAAADPSAMSMSSFPMTGDDELAQFWAFSVSGYQIAFYALIIFIILQITQEYRFALIQSSLLTTPNRLKFYTGKVLTLSVLTTIVYGVAYLLSFCGSFAVNQALGAPMETPGFFQTLTTENGAHILLPTLAFFLFSLLIAALTFIIRDSGSAIFGFISIVLLLPLGLQLALSFSVGDFAKQIFQTIANWTPNQLFEFVSQVNSGVDSGVAWPYAIIGLFVWAGIAKAIAVFTFENRAA